MHCPGSDPAQCAGMWNLYSLRARRACRKPGRVAVHGMAQKRRAGGRERVSARWRRGRRRPSPCAAGCAGPARTTSSPRSRGPRRPLPPARDRTGAANRGSNAEREPPSLRRDHVLHTLRISLLGVRRGPQLRHARSAIGSPILTHEKDHQRARLTGTRLRSRPQYRGSSASS